MHLLRHRKIPREHDAYLEEMKMKFAKRMDRFGEGIFSRLAEIKNKRISEGKEVIDAEGRYAAPGFIDSHIHIESSYVCPEEIGRLLVPHGGTTIMADPHEIVNVCGIAGLDYMMKAAENTVLDVKYELPSCVPATPFEHSGAVIDAEAMKEPITREGIAGLGECITDHEDRGNQGSV